MFINYLIILGLKKDLINVSETTQTIKPTEIIKTELIEKTAKKRGRKPKIKEVDTDEDMIEEITMPPTNKDTVPTFSFTQTNNKAPPKPEFTFGQPINDKSTYDNKAGIDYKGVNQLFK